MFPGNLSPSGTDADWYRHDRPSAFCSEAEASLSMVGQVTLAADTFLGQAVSRGVQPQSPVKIALAAPAGKVPLLGIEPAPSLAAAGDGPTSPGRYTFKFVTHSLADLDPEGNGESPEAGPTAATAVPVPAPCFAARLSASGDDVDRFYFDVAAPRELSVSFAIARGSGAARMTLVSPSGNVVSSLSSGQAADVYASETGRWSLVVAREAAQEGSAAPLLRLVGGTRSAETLQDLDYLAAMSIGPGSDPCRPSC